MNLLKGRPLNSPAGNRPGPRSDRADIRGDILIAARRLFAERGFGGTTIRAVAALAGVDVALVPYYFGNKQALFESALEVAKDISGVLDEVFSGSPDQLGERLATALDQVLADNRSGPAMIALIRSASADGPGSEVATAFFRNVILAAYQRHIDSPDAARRAALATSQIVGFTLARYVIKIQPLATMSRAEVAASLGPTFQRYLVGELA